MQNGDWHSLSVQETLKKMKSSKSGLSEAEARRRIKKYGENRLPEKKRFTYLGVALSQFKSPMIYVLLAAAAISFLLQDYVDAGVILFAVFINTVVGFIQEIKAEQALEALSGVIEHKAYVLRDGIEKEIDSVMITLGDVLVFRAGNKVPADARILESYELEVDESALTGESVPVEKTAKGLDREGETESKNNMVYMGTLVVKGHALAVVTDIASNTKFGQIAELLKNTGRDATPLQSELKKFSNSFGGITFGILLIILAIGIYRGIPFVEMFTTAVAVAVAAIPEGILVAVTIILAIGMQRILKNGSLVRKLAAAETLGSVSVICTDKTGTLTKGTMQVDHIVTLHSFFPVNNNRKKARSGEEERGDHMAALRIGMICNDAVIENPGAELEDWIVHGGYVEKAFLWAGLCAGFEPEKIGRESVRVNEIPFSSERKFMATLNKEDDGHVIYAKGAAEEIINRSRHVLAGGVVKEMDEDDLRFLRQKTADMSREGLQVLGVAFRQIEDNEVALFRESGEEDIVNNLVFVGLVALKDPLREEAKSTLDIAKNAGIRTVIITGDNVLTAKSIANELGMKVDNENILEGYQLDQMSTKEFNRIVGRIKIYARVSPRHKSRIVEAWQDRGEVVAMTGDGVNDAPALKKADIGVALGSGTEVAKETADLVLLDDNFRTIVMAVEEGRAIFGNIRKVILYLISDSFSEVVIVGGSLLLGLAMPVNAAQILWINLVTDGFPNIALTLEPKEKDAMLAKPRRRDEPLLTAEMKILVVAISLVSGIISLMVFVFSQSAGMDLQKASTIVFSILAVDSLIYVFNLRSLSTSVLKQDIFSNMYLIAALAAAFLLQFLAVYSPFLQKVLHTVPLGLADWIIVLSAGLFTAIAVEIIKFFYRSGENQ